MGELTRSWLPKAAVLWVDMERGIYPWPDGKQPRNGDGSYRVVQKQILEDCGLKPSYAGAKDRIWSSPEFAELLAKERTKRDIGIASVINEVEAIKGPIQQMGDKIVMQAKKLFEREPDSEDPTALSPAQYLSEGRQWLRLGLEIEGKLESAKKEGIDHLIANLHSNQQITEGMLDTAMDLIKEHRALQDQKLKAAGIVETIDG